MNDKAISKKTFGKGFGRIMDILDLLEEIKGPFTTNSIVKQMKKTDQKIRHETIKKYLELIHEISNRGILERSFEGVDDSAKLVLWNYKSDKKEDSRKLYDILSKLNTINGVNVEKLRKGLGWSQKRMKNTIRVLIRERMVQFESNKIFLERSWLNFEEWTNRNTINLKEMKNNKTKQKKNFSEKEVNTPKLKKNRE